MSKKCYTLSQEQLTSLRALCSEVRLIPATGTRRRTGENPKALSTYNYSRSFDWSAGQRERFMQCVPDEHRARFNVGHFLEIPVRTGFLDRMVAWKGTLNCGYMISFNIGQHPAVVYLEDEAVEVGVGDALCFSLAEVHEIKPTPQGQLWACVMLVGTPNTWVDELARLKELRNGN